MNSEVDFGTGLLLLDRADGIVDVLLCAVARSAGLAFGVHDGRDGVVSIDSGVRDRVYRLLAQSEVEIEALAIADGGEGKRLCLACRHEMQKRHGDQRTLGPAAHKTSNGYIEKAKAM
jgi:hypothetical protein